MKDDYVTRFVIMARIKHKKGRFLNLYKNGRSYASKGYAKRVMDAQPDFSPEIEMKIKEIRIKICKHCGG